MSYTRVTLSFVYAGVAEYPRVQYQVIGLPRIASHPDDFKYLVRLTRADISNVIPRPRTSQRRLGAEEFDGRPRFAPADPAGLAPCSAPLCLDRQARKCATSQKWQNGLLVRSSSTLSVRLRRHHYPVSAVDAQQ